MNHSIFRAKASLLLIGYFLISGCSFQVPNERDVFASAGGQSSGGNTNTSVGGSTSTAGASARTGGSTSITTVNSSGGAGGTSVNESGGTLSTDTSAGASSLGGGGTPATGGTNAVGGSVTTGGSSAGYTGGAGSTIGGSTNGGAGTATGGRSSVGGTSNTATGGISSTAVGGSGVVTGGAPAAGGTSSTAATGGAATGGAATGGAATGGAATGGAATGGSPTGGAPTGGAPPQVILQYKFDEGSGTTAVDSTANHNDGTLSNVTWSLTGRNIDAANFANPASQITVPSNLLGTSQSLTVSAWVNLTTNTAENRLFYFGTADSTSYFTLTFNNSTNGTSVRFKSPTGTEQVLTTPTQIPTGVWKHITVSVSNVGAALYIDGKIVRQDNTLVMDPTTLGTPMTNLVGASPTAGQNFQGLIDEFYVYNGILPLSDIRQLAWPKSDYSMYHLDEGTGTATVDSSDRAINGTLIGGAAWDDTSPFGTGVKLTNNPTVAPPLQYVDLGDGLVSNCGLNLTVAGWFNIESNTPDAPLFEFAKDTTSFVNVITSTTSLVPTESVFSFNFDNNGTNHIVRVRQYSGWKLSTWTHVAVVRSGTDGRPVALYQDGIKKGTGSTNTGALFSAWGTTTTNGFGRSATNTFAGFNGSVDEVLVSCRAYTDDEIAQLAYVPPN